ncbi:MAG: PAS domain S-box protein, partial [Chloroflexota bacterium]|nr:PAS domain S-box protein [Chloroflexota bacterium]
GQTIAAENIERRRQGIAEQHDFKFRHKDGADVWALISTNPVLDSTGSYAGALAMVTDITARKRADEQLRYQANLLAQVSDAIISTDVNFTIKSWNAAAEVLYGWSAQEVIGHAMSDMLPTRYLSSDAHQSRTSLIEHGRWQGEVIQCHRDGSERTILSSVSLLKDSAGQPAGAVGVNRDITERKRAEAAMERAAERLRVLADASRAFAEVGAEYQALLDQIVRTAATVLSDGCNIRLLSNDGMWLQLVALYDADAEKRELARTVLDEAPLRVDEPSLGTRIFQSGQPLLIPVIDREQARAVTKPEFWVLADRL